MSESRNQIVIEEFIKALAIYSRLVNFDLTDEITMFYVESLKNHDLARCRAALLKFARGAKPGRGLPSVDDILGEVAPGEVIALSAEDDAALAAERIAGCLVKYGSFDDGSKGEFKTQREFIGELGWQVVTASGGWMYLCTTVTNDSLPTLKSQWRKEAASYATRAKAGLTFAPALPAPTVGSLPEGSRARDALQLAAAEPDRSRKGAVDMTEARAKVRKAAEQMAKPLEDDPW